MLKEWLLIIWIGTSTNFNVFSIHWSKEDCNRARIDLEEKLNDNNYVLVCAQDLKEGRSLYQSRGNNIGIVK